MTDQPKTDGRKPFQEWIDSLNDYDAQARVLVRLERVRLGSLGDWKSVGEGVQELRITIGPGYRVYFGQDGKFIVIYWVAETRLLSAKISQTPSNTGRITGAGKMPRSAPYDDYLIESLKDYGAQLN
jgi:putative addiction module killer protein